VVVLLVVAVMAVALAQRGSKFTVDLALCQNADSGACGNPASSRSDILNACPGDSVPLKVDERLVLCGVDRQARQGDVCCVNAATTCGDNGGTCQDGADFSGDLSKQELRQAIKSACGRGIPTFPYKCSNTQACCKERPNVCEDQNGGQCVDVTVPENADRQQKFAAARAACAGENANYVPIRPYKCGWAQQVCCGTPDQ